MHLTLRPNGLAGLVVSPVPHPPRVLQFFLGLYGNSVLLPLSLVSEHLMVFSILIPTTSLGGRYVLLPHLTAEENREVWDG